MLPNNEYFVRKIGSNKTQIFHRMRLRLITPRQPIPDVQITPREWKTDPEFNIKHDDLYVRAWECEYENPKFDSDYNNLVTPNSHEITVRSEEAADEMKSTPGKIRQNSPVNLPPDRQIV